MPGPIVNIPFNSVNLIEFVSPFHSAAAQYSAATQEWQVWVDFRLVRSYTNKESAINEAIRLCSEPLDMGEEPVI